MILIALAVGWIGGLLLGAQNVAPLYLLAPTAACAVLLLRFRHFPPVTWALIACAGAALADERYGLFWQATRANGVAAYIQRSTVSLRGVVAGDATPFGSGDQFPFDVRELEVGGAWEPVGGTVQVRLDGSSEYRVGDRLLVAGVLLPPDPRLPPYESPARQDGVVAIANRPTVTPLGGWEDSPYARIARLREDAASALNAALPEPEAGLARGIALGQRGTLSPELSAAFSSTNTSHILAVDGYKVGLIAAIVDSVLRRLFGLVFRSVGTIGGIALYTIFVGASPSALRAAIMGGIFALGRAVGRPRDTLNGLAIAALVMTAANPLLPWNLAFQLSFSTTLGLAALAPLTEGWIPHRFGLLREAVGATLAAEIASAPLVATAFDHLSLTSLPVHAVVMPLLPIAIVLSGLTALAGLIASPAGNLVGLLAWVPLAGIVGVVQAAGSLAYAALPMPRLGVGVVVGAYGALGLAILARPNPLFGPPLPFATLWRAATGLVPARFLVPALVLPVVVGGAVLWRPSNGVDRIRFLDVSGGDAALVQLADGTNLYLQGDAPAAAVARAADPSLPFWDRSIALAVETGADDQSLTDLGDLAGRLSFRQIVRPSAGYSAVAEQRWQAEATGRGFSVIPADVSADGPGPTIGVGQRATVAVYALAGAPKQGRAAALAPGLALRLVVGPATILWVSALPADQARLAVSGVPLSAQVLKLVGPAARWGLDPGFFQQVNPSIVVLSSGVASRFARPTPGTLDLLADRQVYRTDQDGDVVIAVEPNGLSVTKGAAQ